MGRVRLPLLRAISRRGRCAGEIMRVLIVEDDAFLRDGLRVGLAIGGFNADAVESCEEAAS